MKNKLKLQEGAAMNYLGNNIKKLMGREGIVSETDLGNRVGLPQATINRLVAGDTKDPRISTLELLANYFKVSLNQLLGKDPLSDNHLSQDVFTSIPVISWHDAVKGNTYIKSLTPDTWDKWISVDTKEEEHCFALCSKPSMEPRFPRNTLFIVNPDLKAQDGDLVVVYFERPDSDEATLRELGDDGEKILKSITPDATSTSMENCKILGIVVKSKYTYPR